METRLESNDRETRPRGVSATATGNSASPPAPARIAPGLWVEVKSPGEIAATLDASGTLEGLPFMPEMLACCGRRFRVQRRAEKSCVEAPGGLFLIREFSGSEVFFLEGLRCSGADHDGCQRQCLLFWKAAWLKPAEPGVTEPGPAPDAAALRSQLPTRVDSGRYFCQSTELARATRSGPIGPARILLKCWRDVRSGGVGTLEMLALILVPLYRKVRDKLIGRPRLAGVLKRTPLGSLNLQPGELVTIRTLPEIRATLDPLGRNRGLVADIELGRFCGRQYRVRARLDRMISESNGRMRQVEGTVLLEGNMCLCARALGGCPRLDFCYWREVWLDRVEPTHAPQN